MRVLQVTPQSASLFVTATLKQLLPLHDFYYYARSEQLMPTFEGLPTRPSIKIFIHSAMLIYSDYTLVFSKNLVCIFSSNLHSFFTAKKSYMMWAPNL